MKYRMQIKATICFSVVAKSQREAKKKAEELIDDHILTTGGYEIDIGTSETFAVVYANGNFDAPIDIIDIEKDDTREA